MPEIKKNEDGTVEVKYETGETFTGDPIDVLNKVGEAHVSTKRWAQNVKAENENLKAQHLSPPPPAAPTQPVNQDEAALQSYLLEQHAKALGYKSGSEYQADVQRIKSTTDQAANNQVAESFMLACPEFPSNQDAVDKLTGKIEQMGWDYNQQSLMAAHLMCVREGAYKPLTPEEVNATWAQNMQQSNQGVASRQVPPTPPPPGAPASHDQTNPWAMSTDDLRKRMLEQGGLGKALMELPTGGTLGQ